LIFAGNTCWDTLLFTIGFVLIIMVPFILHPRLYRHDMPEAIKAQTPPLTNKEKAIAWGLLAVLLIFGIGFLVLSALGFDARYAGRPGFWPLFWHLFWQVFTANLVDLVILDWLLFATINPKWMSMPGTHGHPAYREYKSHFIGFLIGTLLAVGVSAVIALIVYPL